MKDFLREHFVAFPDWHEEIELMLAEGDKVACVTMGTGTQTGQMGPFPRSGKKVEVVSIIVHRLERTKIAETWISWDNVAVLTQLGHLAPPV
jgi:predicted ester cyclase